MYYTTTITTNHTGVETTIRSNNGEFVEGWGNYESWDDLRNGLGRDIKAIFGTRYNEVTTDYFVSRYMADFNALTPEGFNDNLARIRFEF